MKKIALINGSLRQGSHNQAILDYVALRLQQAGNTTEAVHYHSLPFLNQDNEYPAPAAVAAVRAQIAAADALWIATPKYNGSVPGGLKTLLDWLSRPLTADASGAPDLIENKLVAISGAAGSHGAEEVLQELGKLLKRMKMRLLEAPAVGLVIPPEAWNGGVMTLSDAQKAELDEEIAAFTAALQQP